MAQAARRNADAVMMYMDEFYFESAAMILTLITVGKTARSPFQGQNHRCAQKAYEASPLRPQTVDRETERSITVPANSRCMKDDIFVVRPGERAYPLTAVVIDGESSAVNESALTGESIPVDKAVRR